MSKIKQVLPPSKSPELKVGERIFTIRGLQVMLDKDLSELYEVETKVLKRAVRANIQRFPEDFMFEVHEDELQILRCKICTSKFSRSTSHTGRGGNRYAPKSSSIRKKIKMFEERSEP